MAKKKTGMKNTYKGDMTNRKSRTKRTIAKARKTTNTRTAKNTSTPKRKPGKKK